MEGRHGRRNRRQGIGLRIVLTNLTRRVGAKHALDDVTLAVPGGCVSGLDGGNGAGDFRHQHARQEGEGRVEMEPDPLS